MIDTRISREGDTIRRRRECAGCGHRFTTRESIVPTELFLIKNDGRREEFDVEKLRRGIVLACRKRPVSEESIDGLVSGVLAQLMARQEREVASKFVGELVMAGLQQLDPVAYVRFASVYREFKDVGQFVSEVRSLTEPGDDARSRGAGWPEKESRVDQERALTQ